MDAYAPLPWLLACRDVMHLSGTTGHRLLFELVAHMLVKAGHALLNPSDSPSVPSRPLPPPIFSDPLNLEPSRETCFVGEKLKAAAVDSKVCHHACRCACTLCVAPGFMHPDSCTSPGLHPLACTTCRPV